MFEKLEAVEKRYEELTKIISDPEVIARQSEWQKAMKEHAAIEEVVMKFREYKKVKQSMEEAEELMQDPDMKELAEEEYYSAKEQIPKIEGEYIWNPSADLNYFAQEEKYEANETPISYLRYFYHMKTDGELRSVLASAGIKGDLAIKPMNSLSGGEQTKVRLALMTMKKSNV